MIIRLFFYSFGWVDRLRASPLQLRCRTIDTSIVALVRLCKHPHSLLRSQAHYESFNPQPLTQSMTDDNPSIFLFFSGEVDRLRALPLQLRCRTIDTSIVALARLCKHPLSLLRSQAHYESFNLQPLKQSMTDDNPSIFFTLLGGLIDLGLHYFEAFLYKHLLMRRRNARSSGDEEANPKHQYLYAVAGAL